jgi:hypothetical protein
MLAKAGDHVRVKESARRGTVEKIDHDNVLVRFEDSGELASLSTRAVTNYSLAARKAWERMPERRVGRPKGSRVCDRLSVTIRIDRSLWNQFKRFEHDGRIADRTGLINKWLRQKLDELGVDTPEVQSHN